MIFIYVIKEIIKIKILLIDMYIIVVIDGFIIDLYIYVEIIGVLIDKNICYYRYE